MNKHALHTANTEQDHTYEDKCEVEGFSLEVALTEDKSATNKGDDNRATAYH